MSSTISLIQFPNLVLEVILKELDYPSIQILRKTCHDLRNFIDKTKPKSHAKNISVQVGSDFIFFKLKFNNSREEILISYAKHGKGCSVAWKTRQKLIENHDFLSVFCKDFEIAMNHQNGILEYFKLNFDFKLDGFLDNFLKILKSEIPKVKYLELIISEKSDFLAVLPYFKADSLEKIWIEDTNFNDNLLEIGEIVKLDQWKKAKEIEILWFIVRGSVKDLSHFSIVNNIVLEEFSADDVVFLKKEFLTSSTMKYFHIGYQQFHCEQHLIQQFGEPLTCTDDTGFEEKRWYFRIPDNNNQVLFIEYCSSFVNFNRIESSEVPDHVVILN